MWNTRTDMRNYDACQIPAPPPSSLPHLDRERERENEEKEKHFLSLHYKFLAKLLLMWYFLICYEKLFLSKFYSETSCWYDKSSGGDIVCVVSFSARLRSCLQEATWLPTPVGTRSIRARSPDALKTLFWMMSLQILPDESQALGFLAESVVGIKNLTVMIQCKYFLLKWSPLWGDLFKNLSIESRCHRSYLIFVIDLKATLEKGLKLLCD